MRALLFTTGSPFARAVRIILDELELEYEKREEITTPTVGERAAATPTLQVPTFWDGDVRLWESGLIAEYLLKTYQDRPAATPPLAENAWRAATEWQDKLIFSTIQTFGSAATTISQMTWSGVSANDNAHLGRSATRMAHVLEWLEAQLADAQTGFFPDRVSIQDIFLGAHVRFVEARPLELNLDVPRYPKICALLSRLDKRPSFTGNPIWWWEPGVISYEADGTPVYEQ